MRFLFLILPILVFSQEKIAEGTIVDNSTDEPIPYVNISIIESLYGTSSDDDGTYILLINNNDFDKDIKLSSLGYKDTTMTVSTFYKTNKIRLTPLVEELEEVVINYRYESILLDIQPYTEKDLYGGFGMSTKPWQIGLYFPYQDVYSQSEYIQNISVLLSKELGFKRTVSKFRVRLFSVSQDSLPKQDILKESIVVTVLKEQKEVIIDLSEHNIFFPGDGIYVVLEGLAIPFNEIETNYTMIVNGKTTKIKREVNYAPSFKAFLGEPGAFLVAHYINGKWRKQPMTYPEENKIFVPAISLTLSN